MFTKWKIEKIISKGDYNYALVPEHPNATKNGYVLEHRIIVENHIGRLLKNNEIIHHINENKKDNRIENLEITTPQKHPQKHTEKQKTRYIKKCPMCLEEYKTRKKEQVFCSRHCNGTFLRWKNNNSQEAEKRCALIVQWKEQKSLEP